MSNWELFQAAYQSASPELKALVDSEKISISVEQALIRRKAQNLQSFVTTQMSYQILGIQTIDSTVKNLQQQGIVDALQFIVEVQNGLANQTPQRDIPTPTNPFQSEISETEKELASLQSVRTMPHDMAAIKPGSDVVYQASSQADILRTPDTGELPNVASATPESTRWDSDTRQ